uniref:Serine/threonine-protein kinase 11-interacting protein n=1 Tax=Angiostrongylus cantonensis TaxID=6313 RepID=A0A0K0DGC1_ANGCA
MFVVVGTDVQGKVTQANIREIHQSHLAAGRLTLAFVQPRVSVMIMKCNPSHLQRFLDNFLAALKGDEITISALDKVKQSDFKAAPKLLRVTNRNLNSITYPPSLETLEVVALGLEFVDSRWFSLSMLSCLDLSYNSLGKASDFVKIRLVSRLKNLGFLLLQGNEIETIPWTASSLLSLCLVGVPVTDFVYETDMLHSVTMRSFACPECVERVVARLRPLPFRP